MVKIFLGFAFAGDYRTMAGACGRDGSAGLLKRVSQRLLQPLDALPSQTARKPLRVIKSILSCYMLPEEMYKKLLALLLCFMLAALAAEVQVPPQTAEDDLSEPDVPMNPTPSQRMTLPRRKRLGLSLACSCPACLRGRRLLQELYAIISLSFQHYLSLKGCRSCFYKPFWGRWMTPSE